MSDTSQGPGWWLASDGKWYPPELWTGPPAAGPSAPQTMPPAVQGHAPAYGGGGWAAAPGQPGNPPSYPAGPYGGASPYQTYGYGQQMPYGAPVAKKHTNGLAIASLVCSCAGILFLGVPGILGIIFGFVARSQIRKSNGVQGGDGLALAGIIVGFAWIAILIVIFIVAAASSNSNGVVHVTNVVHALG
ncbi:MAG TPA: DUF4190 domain-containing protein [Acidimicrobiales bacterium]|nr:DUF4190 domain-containing protein [Acidimicrobiales bacterium]